MPVFFELYEKILKDNNLFNRPHFIFNLDETGLPTDPTAGKIFVRKISKTAYYLASSFSKSMYTVLFCGSANDQYLPPIVVYKALHLYDAWCQHGPENAMCGVTKSGWMKDFLKVRLTGLFYMERIMKSLCCCCVFDTVAI